MFMLKDDAGRTVLLRRRLQRTMVRLMRKRSRSGKGD